MKITLFRKVSRSCSQWFAAAVLLPLSLAAAPLDPNAFTSLGANPFTLAGTYTLDTASNPPVLTRPSPLPPVNGVVSGGVAVFTFDSINIAAGMTVNGVRNAGSRPVALLSRAAATVAGIVDVSGANGAPKNKVGNDAGAGGAVGPGGGGGGCAEIGAVGHLTISGQLNAQGGSTSGRTITFAGAGGGAGGGVLLHGSTVVLAPVSFIRATGGDGELFAGGGGGGRVHIAAGTILAVDLNAVVSVGGGAGSGFGGNPGDPGALTTAGTMAVPVTVTVRPFTGAALSLIVDGVAYTATYTSPQAFYWVEGSSHTLEAPTPQTTGPGVRYVFTSWSDGGARIHTVAPTTDSDFTANFGVQYQLTTAANPAAGGTVTPATGAFFNRNPPVNLQATPNPGYGFAGWSGPVAAPANAATTVTMTGPASVTATFCPLTIAVANTADSGPGSLRQAMVDVCPGGTVTVDAALLGQTLVLTGSPLQIGKHLNIIGPGANQFAISGNHLSRVFTVGTGFTVSIVGLTIENGTAFGGGIFNAGSLRVENSTISGNSVSGSNLEGGGIFTSNADAVIQNCTITGNSASGGFGGGGIFNSKLAAVILENTILAGNTAGTGPDFNSFGGGITGRGHNFIGVTTGISGVQASDLTFASTGTTLADLLDTAAGVPVLADHGGPTFTVALMPGSPAIDAGSNAVAAGLAVAAFDQRGPGSPRRTGTAVDIGAFELQYLPLTEIILEPAAGGGTQARVSFATVAGRSYRIQSTDNLASAAWATRATVTVGTTGRLTFIDPPPLPPSRFYRTISP